MKVNDEIVQELISIVKMHLKEKYGKNGAKVYDIHSDYPDELKCEVEPGGATTIQEQYQEVQERKNTMTTDEQMGATFLSKIVRVPDNIVPTNEWFQEQTKYQVIAFYLDQVSWTLIGSLEYVVTKMHEHFESFNGSSTYFAVLQKDGYQYTNACYIRHVDELTEFVGANNEK